VQKTWRRPCLSLLLPTSGCLFLFPTLPLTYHHHHCSLSASQGSWKGSSHCQLKGLPSLKKMGSPTIKPQAKTAWSCLGVRG
jgi:hypothetical protein